MKPVNAADKDARAVALKYRGAAPEVTATGQGLLAEQIIEIARESGVPMFENRELAELLARLALGDEIPRELYIAIAQVLALAFELQDKAPPGWTRQGDRWERSVAGDGS